ncbi:MAG: class I tRNA ligase family protein, partial [Candidatus Levybacteria bacterium]|nr:class I tRNA ligase family protein [Candidatus Levybacteria bacterium]
MTVKSDSPKYQPQEIEQKWQAIWEKEGVYKPDLDKARKPFYNLMMFPYPSAEGMHVGNMYAFTGADVYGRFQRMQGNDVFEPIGLDGFGIHSENYAIKVGKHPVEQAKASEKNFYRQLRSIGNGFDWTRTVETYKPEYYKWTQWIFIQLFKAGLAYRKKAPVNFCPSCKTVLADEQVLEGLCERCNSVVEKRDLEQWFF